MATSPLAKLRVMVDANVLISGTGWPRFAYEVLQHAIAADFQLVLSPFVIDEARRHITRLFPEFIEPFETFLENSHYELVATPSEKELAEHPNLVRDRNDIPVALAAINANVDYLLSSDKDLTEPAERIHQRLHILLPGAFLRQHMGWTSEQLEIIHRRNWKDVHDD